MSSVLRISTTGPLLSRVRMTAYRVEGSVAHFNASSREFDDLPGQVADVVVFLTQNREDIESLLAAPGASGVVDFAVEGSSESFRYLRLPVELTRIAGSIGLALELSVYPEPTSDAEV